MLRLLLKAHVRIPERTALRVSGCAATLHVKDGGSGPQIRIGMRLLQMRRVCWWKVALGDVAWQSERTGLLWSTKGRIARHGQVATKLEVIVVAVAGMAKCCLGSTVATCALGGSVLTGD